MPNRILKESICLSESLQSLSWFEEVFFYRLLVCCDDYGCFYARDKIIKGRLFPLKDLPLADIRQALAALAKEGLLVLYEHEGQPYLQLTAWHKHQKIRNVRSKFPLPPDSMSASSASKNPRDSHHGDFSLDEKQQPASVTGPDALENSGPDKKNGLQTIADNCPPESESESQSQSVSQSESISESHASAVIVCDNILSFLNTVCKTNFRMTPSTKALLMRRLQEGFAPEDFHTVIVKKHRQWADNPLMAGYLRPETLFSDKHFATYLHEPVPRTTAKARALRLTRPLSDTEKQALRSMADLKQDMHGTGKESPL